MVMLMESSTVSLAVALAVGLLVGVDREKQKNAGASSDAAGIRTFSLVALIGAACGLLGSNVMVAVLGLGIVALTVLSYWGNQSHYPGLTTEFALLATFGVGFLAAGNAPLAAALGVLLTLVVSSKSRLHRFATSQLSEQELHDATLLAGAALIILPLLPNAPVDPFGVVNLHLVWGLTLLMLSINALGYVARRAFGAEVGLAVAGFCGGFISSILSIVAMGRQAKRQPHLLSGAVAGAAFSSIATAIELIIIVAITDKELLPYLGPGIAVTGLIAAFYGAAFQLRSKADQSPADAELGRAFEPKYALLFACAFAVMLLLAALLQRGIGSSAALLSIALGGLIDTHAATASAARLASSGNLSIRAAALAAILAISVNIVAKMAMAVMSGGRRYALQLCPSHLAMLAALWLCWFFAAPVHGPI